MPHSMASLRLTLQIMQSAICDIVTTLQNYMDKHYFWCGVFIDLKKSFDNVNHKILLDNLHFYGFWGIINKWFKCNQLKLNHTYQLN